MKRLLVVALLLSGTVHAQDISQFPQYFDQAGREFQVPPAVLKGIAFAETRWQPLVWSEGDTASCMGLPREYGVMALRDDDFFGHSLRRGADLIGQDVSTVKTDVMQNMRAAAAYLHELYAQQPLPAGTTPGSLESWQNAIAAYCGIPQADLAAQHALEIYQQLSNGYHQYGIAIEPHQLNLQVIEGNARQVWAEARSAPSLAKRAAQPDYPLAHWVPAYDGHWYTTGYGRYFIVIHEMEGYYLATISYFQQAGTSASVHYDVNGKQDSPSDAPAGDITQQVEEQYWAWHAVCLNRYSLGIEHEGFISNPGWWTPEMYISSAKLVRYMCDKYGIPKDRNHIIGHDEYLNSAWVNWANTYAVPSGQLPSNFTTCNSHTDPGPLWDWGFYMQMIQQDSTAPRVTSTPPSARVQVYEKVQITFNQRMEPTSTQASFHIVPALAGSLSWSTDARTLIFTPTTNLNFDTLYTVTVDTSAHNYLNVRLDVNGDGIGGETYSYTFRTVEHDTTPPAVTAVYPPEGRSGVSQSVEFQIDFNEPIDNSTLPGGFVLQDSTGTVIPLSTPVATLIGQTMRVTLHPVTDLAPEKPYTFTVNQNPHDFGGNSIAADLTYHFRTSRYPQFTGTVINNLDAVGSWWQPGTSGSTVGITSATFSIATDIKKAGTGSGKIAYAFSGGSGGVIREYNSGKPGVDPGPLVSAWVYGDNSGNQLGFAIYTPTYVVLPVDTLNWTGWKLVTTSIAALPTPRTFAGFIITQLPGARTNGTVYFDDLATGSAVTTDVPGTAQQLPIAFQLDQNYPNPFNPATSIAYTIPSAGVVHVRIYDALGREVATLVDGPQDAGEHRVTWNAGGFTSGVYFCRLQAGNRSETRKMLLLK